MSLRIGRMGDLYAAAIIESFGINVSIVNREGCDLIARYNGFWIPIEVKATTTLEKGRRCYTWNTSRGNSEKKNLDNRRCDVVALVALDVRKTVFRHVSEIKGITTHIWEQRLFEIDEKKSWIEACEKLKK